MKFDDPRIEWRISDIERKLAHKVDQHEISSMHSNVDGLQRSIREISSEISSLRNELQEIQENIRKIMFPLE